MRSLNPPTWRSRGWHVAYGVLLSLFLLAGALNMAEMAGGFLTNHLADVVGPAWLYVVMRGLDRPARSGGLRRLGRMLSATPERSAAFLFLGSTVTEVRLTSPPASRDERATIPRSGSG